MEPHQRPRPASPGRRGDACNGSCCAGVGRLSLEESTDCLHCQIGNGRLCRVAASNVIVHGQYCCSIRQYFLTYSIYVLEDCKLPVLSVYFSHIN